MNWLRNRPDIDAAARDGRTSLVARGVVALVSAAIQAANFGIASAALWLSAYAAAELWDWAATRNAAAGGTGTPAERLSYLLSTVAMTLNWTLVGVLFWSTAEPGLRLVAVVGFAAQLIHAQAFAFRSLPVLLINGGIPAAALVILPIGFGGFGGLELTTVIVSLVVPLFYVAASARANIVAAARLARVQAELEALAYVDSLTLLGNRRLFADNLRKCIAASTAQGSRFALLMVDLDRFKAVNDSLGHAAGDVLLVEVGMRLRDAVGGDGEVARTGGDEFAILLGATAGRAEIEALCRRIVDSFADAIEFNGVKVAASVSVGVAVFPDDGTAPDSLLRAADLALYESKHCGRATWRYSTVA